MKGSVRFVFSTRLFRTFAPVATGALLVLSLAACGSAQSSAAPDRRGGAQAVGAATGDQVKIIPVDQRQHAPPVKGTTLKGKTLRLSAYRGKVVVVNFWASWCAPCRAEAPALEHVYKRTRSDGVRFLGVDIKDDRDAALAFYRTHDVGYPSIYDQPGRVALLFRDTVPPSAIPSTIVIDQRGRIAARVIGQASRSTLGDIVTQLASGGS
ncbi:MAG: TlpA family protein disulfide reductase [Streptosporangiaceae bacterium]